MGCVVVAVVSEEASVGTSKVVVVFCRLWELFTAGAVAGCSATVATDETLEVVSFCDDAAISCIIIASTSLRGLPNAARVVAMMVWVKLL